MIKQNITMKKLTIFTVIAMLAMACSTEPTQTTETVDSTQTVTADTVINHVDTTFAPTDTVVAQ